MLAQIGRHPEEFGDREVLFTLFEFAFEGLFETVKHLCDSGELLVVRTEEAFFECFQFETFELVDLVAVTNVPAVEGGFGHANGFRDLRERNALGTERSEEHTSELQSPCNLVCRLLLEKKKQST